jgi:WD domain, G-beta repeat
MKGRSVHDLLQDYNDILERVKDLPKDSARRLRDYDRFVRTRSHILARDPAQLFAQAAAQAKDSAVRADMERLPEEARRKDSPWFWLRHPPESDPQRALLLTIDVGSEVNAVATLCLDGRPHALAGSRDGVLRLFDLTTGRCVREFLGHTHWVRAVALAGDGRHALSGSDDHTVRWWELASGQCLAVFNCEYPVTSVALSWQRPSTAVAGDDHGRVYIFDLAEPAGA